MLRARPQAYSITALLGATAALFVVVLFGQVPGENRWASVLTDAAHGPAFAAMTLLLAAMLRRAPGRVVSVLRDYALAIFIALLLGVLIELLQQATGRDASADDVRRDMFGALAAVGFLTLLDPQVRALPSRRLIQLIGGSVGVVSTLIVIAPVAVTAAAHVQRHHSFPTLAEFGSPVDTYFLGVYSAVTVKRDSLPHRLIRGPDSVRGLYARLNGNEEWALVLWGPYPDWSDYQRLALDIANPTNVPLVLTLKVRDQNHISDKPAGYIGTTKIAPHTRKTHVVRLQEMIETEGQTYVDLADVALIVLTGHPANEAQEFFVVRVWLE